MGAVSVDVRRASAGDGDASRRRVHADRIGLGGADVPTRASDGGRPESVVLTAEQPRIFELIP